jgi:hypothetical protein
MRDFFFEKGKFVDATIFGLINKEEISTDRK